MLWSCSDIGFSCYSWSRRFGSWNDGRAGITRCIASPHFQVAERALNMFDNVGIFAYIHRQRKAVFPIVV